MALHDLEELDDDLGARSDHDLALAGLLTVVDGVEGIVEDGSKNHFCGIETEILKSLKVCEMRYLRRRENENVSLRWPEAWRVPSIANELMEGFCRSVLKRRSVSGLFEAIAKCFLLFLRISKSKPRDSVFQELGDRQYIADCSPPPSRKA